MKKIFTIIVLTLAFGNQALAINVDDDLLPRPGELWENASESEELAASGNLPKVSIENFYATIIKTVLGWAMLITLAAIVVAAIYYLKSRGKEEDISKAKDIILYLAIGMGIMAGAYGIVSGLVQFEFFE